jgi:hypothetical protein
VADEYKNDLKKDFSFEVGTGCGLTHIHRRIKLGTFVDRQWLKYIGFMIIN